MEKRIIGIVLFLSLSMSSCYVYKPMEKPAESKKAEPILMNTEESLKNLQRDAYYTFKTEKNTVKMRYQNIFKDSIIGYKIGKPEKTIKVENKAIIEIRERRFSKMRSDIVTYFGIAAAATGIVYLIIQN